MHKPLVSIIIPNFNNADRLQLCLEAIMRQTFPFSLMEIIVVDNGSSDHSTEISKKYPVQVFTRAEYQSPYWCRNAGIRAAKGKILILLDSNCVPVDNWLQEGIDCMQHSTASIFIGPVRFNFTEKFTLSERIDYLYSVVTPEDVRDAEGLPGGHLFIRKVVFEKIGYFIPNYRSLGDLEWTQRAKKAGYSFGFCKNAIVDYPSKSGIQAFKKMIRLGGGKKELWTFKGKSLLHPFWILQILKNLLPPSPNFYREMAQRNQDEQTQIPPAALFIGLYLIKLCYAWGMLFKKLPRPLPNPDYSTSPMNNDDN